ncbi:redoxin domain-containing protein [Sphingobacterium composti Ten et al. 2007 non Yoo et al. 2007]|uniref:redoxin domain-containing protein n=1 Tax=Sphingobacterium composti TaxID=363260 RepID=UPI00135C864E|nr:redoxin domain-containing protein [Sphingobacterium composti Ten et al. 2007 non Yoo et al. 2007]
MKRTILTIALIAGALAYNNTYAQLAKKKGITLEEISKDLGALAQKNDEVSKTQLLVEAKALVESKNESFVNFGTRIYSFLEKTDEVEKVEKTLLKRFPKGLKARSEAYKNVFSESNTSASVAEKSYNDFLKKFPSNNFEEKDRGLYRGAESKLAAMYFKENNLSKANEYVDKLKNSPMFIQTAYGLTRELAENKDYVNALPILEEGIAKAKEDNKVGPTYLPAFNAAYGKALYETGNYEKAIESLEDQFITNNNAAVNSDLNVSLANSYIKMGRDLDAFLLLEKYVLKNGKNDAAGEVLKSLYSKLNNDKSDFNNYYSNLDTKIKEASIAKYKSEMIKKEAPAFSLVNREGKTVSLADLKGKVVVLDFWATWCGPCINSFPGMQAAVNKYKDDKEVEFLFIDTWQREENYKELVEQFITKNNYTFHVLFDEMKDREKATTTAYGVKGIPHKVVIDKEGFIRFESSGSGSDIDKIVSEMETKIELARKG